MIGFIPVAGDIIIISFAIDMGTDYMAEKAEAEQNLRDIQSTFAAIDISYYCEQFYLTAVVISDGTAGQQIIVSLSPETENLVQNINTMTNEDGIDIQAYGLTPPLTTSQVLENPEGVNRLLDAIGSDNEEYLLNPRN
jgi:hypothetical protein